VTRQSGWTAKVFGYLVLATWLGGPAGAAEPYPRSVAPPPGCPEPAYHRLEVTSKDGTKLAVHEWAPPQVPAGSPVVVLIHGIALHGAPYASVAAGFTARGIPLMVPDLRGHGRSEGERGVLAEPHVLRADLGAVLDAAARRHPNAPLVLAGESMGGLLAADYAWRGERRLAGLALLVPAFGVHPTRLAPSTDALELLRTGWVPLDSPDNLAASSRDRGFIKARRDDPLALHAVRPAYLTTVAKLQVEWQRAGAEVRVPLFVGVAGRDRIIDNQAVDRVFRTMGTPRAEKTWREWGEACHTVCWDPATPQVISELAGWTLERRPGQSARDR
jgi:alpha-beta hydrolase superfamily lysophospholipase